MTTYEDEGYDMAKFDYKAMFEEYFEETRRTKWDRACPHDTTCSCAVWDRDCKDLETYSEGKLQVVHFGNKLNLGGCNACSAKDGRAHHFDKITAYGDCEPQIMIISCDCLYRLGNQPKGCICPDGGYGNGEEE
jgi:hypothetical protein